MRPFLRLSSLCLSALLLAAAPARSIPLPERLAALGLTGWSALHDEVDEGGGKGGGGQHVPGERIVGGVGCGDGDAAGFACQQVDLMAFLPLDDIGGGSGNDVWGWTDRKTGREYVLMGRSSGVSFVDVTDPARPVYLGDLPTHTFGSVWRDLKVYRDHLYVVADSAGQHGMQVFDLRQLRSVESPPAVFAESAHYDDFGSAHNIAINEETGYAYVVGAVGSCDGGLHMVDLARPRAPVFAGCYGEDGYTHDVQCVLFAGPDRRYRGSEICFAANEDTLTVVDVSDKDAPRLVSRSSYEGFGYAHQGWLTEDHAHFLLDDELDESAFRHGTRTLVWDLSDLERPAVAGEHFSAVGSIDHNQYVVGDFVYQANYRSGLRVLELTDLARGRMREVAFFDTYPEDDETGFDGAWGVYPFFASGVVAVSDINRGLFVVRPRVGEAIFADGFESGDLSAWSGRRGPGLEVVAPGLGETGFALAVSVDAGRSHVAARLPDRQATLRMDLLLHAGRADLAGGEVEIARLKDRKRTVVSLSLEQRGGRYEVHLAARSGKRMVRVGSTRVPANREIALAVEWRRASSRRAEDGRVSLFKEGRVVAEDHHLANGRRAVTELLAGLPGAGTPAGASGAFLLDEIAVRP
ncbi:MAG: choice-of-anchor B family protein [Thermoanaerobaculia bacterium]|nr:choice-of-anchor B family protein [Thermoanaerobaculia bacterium]